MLCEVARQNALRPAIVVTGQAEVPAAIRATKLGTIELVDKPFGGVAVRRARTGLCFAGTARSRSGDFPPGEDGAFWLVTAGNGDAGGSRSRSNAQDDSRGIVDQAEACRDASGRPASFPSRTLPRLSIQAGASTPASAPERRLSLPNAQRPRDPRLGNFTRREGEPVQALARIDGGLVRKVGRAWTARLRVGEHGVGNRS